MKKILLFLLPVVTIALLALVNPNDKEVVANTLVTVTVIDLNTNETLAGVEDTYSNDYTNLDGQIVINKGEDINLSFISYDDVKIENIESDTIIYLSN